MSEDLIKREDAIEACCKGCGWKESQCDQDSGFWCESGALIRRDIPSADRPQGEWRKHDDERDYCTRCKHIFKTRTITQRDKWTVYIDDLGYNFCPNCGAKMKGVANEN